MKNMKKLIKLSIVIILIINTSCNDKKITNLRGKVKLETISLSTKVPGRVEVIRINEGQKVHKGDTV